MIEPAGMFDPLLNGHARADGSEPDAPRWRPITPVPEDVTRVIPRHRLGQPSAIWDYFDAQGRLIFRVARWDHENGKTILPLTYCENDRGERQWRWQGLPAPHPLYGLDCLAARANAPVLATEGEKAADAAGALFPEQVAITSPNGAEAANYVDWSPLSGRHLVIWPDNDSKGRTYADDVARLAVQAGAESVRIVAVPSEWPKGWDLADQRPEGVTVEVLHGMLDNAGSWDQGEADTDLKGPPPLPLIREFPEAPDFPIEALGRLAADAAMAIGAMTGAPLALCATSVLGAIALAAQSHADVQLPHGAVVPLSLYLLVVAASGERKSAVDRLALKPVAQREEDLRRAAKHEEARHETAHTAWEAARKNALKSAKGVDAARVALEQIGPPPERPLGPVITCGEPTIEGLRNSLKYGQPSQGIFTAEGGEFIGGHALKDDAKLRSITGLSLLWDGQPYKNIRADNATILAGRRLSMCLMVQPDIAIRMCGDRVLKDQGLLSRFLPTFPTSTMGTRFSSAVEERHANALSRYHARMLELLGRAPPLKEGTRNELVPRPIAFTPEAAALLTAFSDTTEAQLRKDGLLFPVRGFGAKLAEQAGRIAGGLSLFEADTLLISVERTEGAILLAQYYASEALRLFGSAHINADTMSAEDLRIWLLDVWKRNAISVRDVVWRGPNALRETSRVRHLVRILVDHGWLVPVGKNRRGDREVYQVVRGGR